MTGNKSGHRMERHRYELVADSAYTISALLSMGLTPRECTPLQRHMDGKVETHV